MRSRWSSRSGGVDKMRRDIDIRSDVEIGMPLSDNFKSGLVNHVCGSFVHRERRSRHVLSSRKVFLRLGESEDRLVARDRQGERPRNLARMEILKNLINFEARDCLFQGAFLSWLLEGFSKVWSEEFEVLYRNTLRGSDCFHITFVSNGVAWKRTGARSRSLVYIHAFGLGQTGCWWELELGGKPVDVELVRNHLRFVTAFPLVVVIAAACELFLVLFSTINVAIRWWDNLVRIDTPRKFQICSTAFTGVGAGWKARTHFGNNGPCFVIDEL
ncbi:hypothetical protein Tco_0017360 [Tanacetum coccineum]